VVPCTSVSLIRLTEPPRFIIRSVAGADRRTSLFLRRRNRAVDGDAMGQRRLKTVDEIVERYARRSTPVRRRIYVAVGCIFVVFAIIGIWVPGWPTVSWAVPAAYLFSLSNQRLFRWTLTNRFFGSAMFDYYATGKTVPKHAKMMIIAAITVMSAFSIWLATIAGDPGYGQVFIAIAWAIGVWWLAVKVETR